LQSPFVTHLSLWTWKGSECSGGQETGGEGTVKGSEGGGWETEGAGEDDGL